MKEFLDGMHRVGDALSAVVSAQVTREAQDRLLERKQGPPAR